MEEISYSGANSPIKRRVSKRLMLFSVFFVIILLLLGSVAYFVTSSGENEPEETIAIEENTESIESTDSSISESPTEVPEVTEAPTSTPKATPVPTEASAGAANSSVEIAVQNGSGEAGVAGEAADILIAEGYKVVSTGNAENFEYTGVTIQVKAARKSILSGIESALSKDYTVSKATSDLPTDASYDALVIIGK